MNTRALLTAVGIAALVTATPIMAQGRSGGTPGAGMGATASGARGGMGASMGVGVGAGPSSPNGVGAGSLASGLTGLDRAAEVTGNNEHATAGFTSAMDLRAAAQTHRTTARAHAQAKAHAADKAKAKANENSVLNNPDN